MRWLAVISLFILLAFHVPIFAGNPPDQAKSSITATTAPADGTSFSTVTITLKDAGGNALSGNDSVLITSSDSNASFDPSSFTLDGSGIITTRMRSRTVESVPVIVTDVTTGNTRLTWSVSFYQPGYDAPTPTSTPMPGACTDAAPGGAAQLTSAVSTGAHTITLTWAAAVNPVSYYLLSYGIAPGQYIYGNPNIGGRGATTYSVGGLTTGKKYYFVVRAGNGCMPGTNSNELSATAGETPTPTPQPEANIILEETSTPAPVTPTHTPAPDLSSQTPVPQITPAVAGPDAFISYIMIGATAVGVACALAGAFLALKLKKRRCF